MTDELREMARELADEYFLGSTQLVELALVYLLRAKESGEREERDRIVAFIYAYEGHDEDAIGDLLRFIRQDTGRG